jgi:hypothetical protein
MVTGARYPIPGVLFARRITFGPAAGLWVGQKEDSDNV